jgi:uncharacterized membrane protein YfcA
MSGYAHNGLFTSKVLSMVLMLYPVLFLGMYAGHQLHIRIDQRRFNQLISVLLMHSGIALMIKSVAAMS